MAFKANFIEGSNDLPPHMREILRLMIGQLPIVWALQNGGEVRVPVAEIDACGGYILNIRIEGTDFIFSASKKQ